LRGRGWALACALGIGLSLAWAGVRAAEPSSDVAVSPKTGESRVGVASERAAAEGNIVPADRSVAAEAAARDVASPPPPSVHAASQAATPAAAPEAGGTSKSAAKGQKGDASKGILPGGSNDKPLAIRSDELEAVEESGTRNLLFQRNVHVEQGDLVVNSDRLEAHYPPGANQPDRLVATGHVRIKQKDRLLTCQNATYYQGEERLVCVGDADLLSGNDRVHGDQIEIFTSQNRMKVLGRAVVNVTPDQKPEPKKAEATP
jgi:lipopolysaccharide transport protein LptA